MLLVPERDAVEEDSLPSVVVLPFTMLTAVGGLVDPGGVVPGDHRIRSRGAYRLDVAQIERLGVGDRPCVPMSPTVGGPEYRAPGAGYPDGTVRGDAEATERRGGAGLDSLCLERLARDRAKH